MDKIKAKQLFDQLKGIEIEGITIDTLIDNGKSAVVFRGKKGSSVYAIKIFDNDLVEQVGCEIQQQRIEHELSLKEYKISTLVRIFGGGNTIIGNNQYFYLIMEFIEGMNLKNHIKNNTLNTDFIIKVINTLLDTSEKLLQLEQPLAHRDIKPENIMVTASGDIILMDLGVLKLVGIPSITDINEKQFLGTLRYAPPEFLTRQEEDSKEGWRAINIYQIGTVLHDLIMKKELFEEVEPYPNLVIAIKEDMPSIISKDFHPDMVQLARNMLYKDWQKRLKLSPVEAIKNTLVKCLSPGEEPVNLYNDIKKDALSIQVELEKIETITRTKAEKEKIMLKINFAIWKIIDECFNGQDLNEMIKNIVSTKLFHLDAIIEKMPKVTYRFYHLTGKFEYGFAKSFLILFKVENDENSYCKLSISGIIPSLFMDKNVDNPEKLMYELFSPEKKYPTIDRRITNPPELTIPLCCFFDGIIEFGDNSIKNLISEKTALIIKRIVQRMKPDIQAELERRKNMAGSGPGVSVAIWRSAGASFIEI
jgi:serine/threonine protein kinase